MNYNYLLYFLSSEVEFKKFTRHSDLHSVRKDISVELGPAHVDGGGAGGAAAHPARGRRHRPAHLQRRPGRHHRGPALSEALVYT